MHVDFGTGDGAYAYRLARARVDTLVVGVDANADGLVETSTRAAAKPARGGVANLVLGRLALAEAPGALEGLAHSFSVVLPWGSLLEAVATPSAADVARLRGLLRPGGAFEVWFGYSAAADGLALPVLDAAHLRRLAQAWEGRARFATLDEVRDLPSTWAKKLAFSGKHRAFVKIEGKKAFS